MVRQPNALFRIPAGVLTLDSGWTPPLGQPFERAILDAPEEFQLDLGCSLMHGGFVVERAEPMSTSIVRSEPKGSLMFFLQRLYTQLQSMATVPVMDLALYASNLETDR